MTNTQANWITQCKIGSKQQITIILMWRQRLQRVARNSWSILSVGKGVRQTYLWKWSRVAVWLPCKLTSKAKWEVLGLDAVQNKWRPTRDQVTPHQNKGKGPNRLLRIHFVCLIQSLVPILYKYKSAHCVCESRVLQSTISSTKHSDITGSCKFLFYKWVIRAIKCG